MRTELSFLTCWLPVTCWLPTYSSVPTSAIEILIVRKNPGLAPGGQELDLETLLAFQRKGIHHPHPLYWVGKELFCSFLDGVMILICLGNLEDTVGALQVNLC